MKKPYLFTTLLCLTAITASFAQNPISVDASFTANELVNNILINSSCVGVSNISVADGTSAGVSSIGLFSATGSDFPFQGGIILSTGNILNAPGPTGSITSSGEWPGDTGLQALNTANGNAGALHDATVIEFDFVPLISDISFDFIFASNEYGTYQCSFADIFAFMLTDLSTGSTSNLAVIPGSEIPISVTTIRDTQYNTGCASANVGYFGSYYFEDPLAPINYRGTTIPITAQSPVIPGHAYHIKMAIADYMDSAFDSAVFIGSASFNIGDFDQYLAIESTAGNIICSGAETTLSIPPVQGFTYQWNLDGEPVDGATTSSLTVGEAGLYSLEVTSPLAECFGIASYTLAFGITQDQAINFLVQPITVTADEQGIATFDFTQAQAAVLANFPAGGYAVSFYASANDAENNLNALPLYYTTTEQLQTVYARLENIESGCYTITSFQLFAETAAAVAQTAFNGFSYVPNPVTDKLSLSNNTTIDKIEIYNLLGQKQLEQPIAATTAQLRLNSLQQGVYILKVYSGDSQKAVRVIKQ